MSVPVSSYPNIPLDPTELVGEWQQADGQTAKIELVGGQPVLSAFGRRYEGENLTPKGFAIYFRPKALSDFRNVNLPEKIRQQLLDKHYQQEGYVDITDPDTLNARVFLDKANFETEDPSGTVLDLQSASRSTDEGRFKLTRGKSISLLGINFFGWNEPVRKLVEQIKAIDEQVIQATADIEDIQADRKTHDRKIKEAEQKLAESKAKVAAASEALEKKINPEKDALEKLKEKIAELEAEQAALLSKNKGAPNGDPLKDSYWNDYGDYARYQQLEKLITDNKYDYEQRVSQVEKMRPNPEFQLGITDAAQRLSKALEAFETLEKNKITLETKQEQLGQKLAAGYLKRAELVHSVRPYWEKVLEWVPPYDKAVQITLDGKVVYDHTWQKPNPDSQDIEEELKKLNAVIPALEANSNRILQTFNAESKMASDALVALGGTDKGKSILGNGLILSTAQTNAVLDFSIDMFELVEAFGEGGFGGVIVEGTRKIVLNSANQKFDNAIDFNSLNAESQDVYQRILNEFNSATNVSDPLSTRELQRTLINRGIDQVTPEMWNAALGGLMWNTYGDKILTKTWAPDWFFTGYKGVTLSPSTAKVLMESNEKISQFPKGFLSYDNFEAPLTSLKNGLIKDAIKTLCKRVATEAEMAAWNRYFEHDAKARVAYSCYQASRHAYWKAQESANYWFLKKLLSLKIRDDELAARIRIHFDPKVRIRAGQVLEVKTTPKRDIDRETAQMGGVAFEKKGEHQFSLMLPKSLIEQFSDTSKGYTNTIFVRLTQEPDTVQK